MRVEMAFDENEVRTLGFEKNDAHYTVKKMFEDKDLPCIENENKLVFEDKDRKDDYSNMWIIIMSLLRADWFVKCATSCLFFDDEDDEGEDVLAQAWKVRR